MGNNQLAVSGSLQELHLQDLAEGIVQDRSLGNGRLLKSVQCWTEEGMPVVVKVYLKREDDPPLALAPHHSKLKGLIEKLSLRNQPNVLSYHRMVETDKAGYLVRQYCYSNLADRISTRPFFSNLGKRWIAYQILQGLYQIHKVGLYHGDLKADNIVLTAWDWVFLTDLAPFKPSRIPDDDPSFFSYYFDTAERRICLLAPERFYPSSLVNRSLTITSTSNSPLNNNLTPNSSTNNTPNNNNTGFVMIDMNGGEQFVNNEGVSVNNVTLNQNNTPNQPTTNSTDNNNNNQEEVTEKMDIFSAGCVIAQLFLDGEALFDFSQLLAFRKGETDHYLKLMERIEDNDVREMITHMLDLDPNKRLSAEEYIKQYTPKVFPIYFKFIHEKVMSQMIEKNCDGRIQTIASMYDSIIDVIGNGEQQDINLKKSLNSLSKTVAKTVETVPVTEDTNPNLKKNTLLELIQKTKDFENNLNVKETEDKKSNSNNDTNNKQTLATEEKLIDKRNLTTRSSGFSEKEKPTYEGVEIIATLLCSSVRNAQSVGVRVQGLTLLKQLADYSSNYTRLERLVPYACALLNDQSPLVKSTAIDTLTYVLSSITSFTAGDSNLFNDYILPALRTVSTDKSDMVRVTFAENLPLLAYQARRFLEMSQIIKQNIHQNDSVVMVKGTYDSDLNFLQNEIGTIVLELSMDLSTVVKRALLKNITQLCIFYGRRKTNDFVLPMIITFLNSRQWRLRYAFYEQMVGISVFVGPTSLKEFILPCLMQALYDVQEFVIEQGLNGFISLCELGMFDKTTLVDEISRKVSLLLHHPNSWIRYNAIAFFAAASKQLGLADTSCFLLDLLRPHLAYNILLISEYSLLESVKPALSRDIFEKAIKVITEATYENGGTTFESWVATSEKNGQLSEQDIDLLHLMRPYLEQLAMATQSKSWETVEGEAQVQGTSDPIKLNLPLHTHFVPIESPYITLQTTAAINSQSTNKSSQSKQFNNDWNAFFNRSGKLQRARSKSRDGDDLKNLFVNSGPLLSSEKIARWRPNGSLFGQSTEHKGPINELAVHESLAWFVSGGNDGTVRLWDLNSSDRDFALTSKMTYTITQGGGRINSVAILNATSPLITTCTDKGWVHVFSADLGSTMYTILITEKGAKFVQSKSSPSPSMFESSVNVVRPFVMNSLPLLICGNQNGVVAGIDPRCAKEAFSWKSKESLEQGPISSICCGDNEPWMVTGTKRGYLTLWDMRYQINVSNTRVTDSAINKICLVKNTPNSTLTSNFNSPSICIASQGRDIDIWNLENQQTVYKFRCSLSESARRKTVTTQNEPQTFSGVDPFAINEIKKVVKDRRLGTEEPNFEVKALYVNEFDGSFYSGSSDGTVRFWDTNQIEQSYISDDSSCCTIYVEDNAKGENSSLNSYSSGISRRGGTFSTPVVTHHLDTITDITVVSSTAKGHYQPLLITSSRDGVLKVWK
ncbi:hypothetical protein ABK040_013380 [Willaertia magna]